MRNLIKPFTAFVCLLLVDVKCCAQHADSVITLNASRHWQMTDPNTGKTQDFELCGDDIYTDSVHFFCMMSGCEKNVAPLLGKYTFANDTITITPFDFILENPFVNAYKVRARTAVQTIKFLSASNERIGGADSCWIVRCFKERKQVWLNFSTNGIVTFARGKYSGVELLQLTKIFGVPIVMFLDSRFDYTVVVNIPTAPLIRNIKGAAAIQGKMFITGDSLRVDDTSRAFKILYTQIRSK